MKRLLLVFILLASPAWGQVNAMRKNAAGGIDPCAPIGRTADGQLVYSMKCANLPTLVTPTPAPQARSGDPSTVEPEVERSGIFGMSYRRKPASE